MSDDGKHQEIVIIRRGGHGAHDEHHGGVWKIAFADFMTAMMAFFLVMWLISANDKTRASVARYFNPVRLVDATTQPRGLHDTKKDESGITATPDDAKKADDKADKQGKPETTSKDSADAKPGAEKPGKETPAAREKRLDATLRENPYVALAEIAAAKTPGEGPAPIAPPTPAVGRHGGETFRDPFAPPPPLQAGSSDKDALPSDEPPPAAKRDALKPVADKPVAVKPGAAERTVANNPGAGPDAAGIAPAVGAKGGGIKGPEASSAEAKSPDAKSAEAKALLAALGAGGRDGPQVDVRRTTEGLLVSFTDTAVFSMFSNGSAVPSRKVVLLMERTARLMKGRAGSVIVRGFTDSKPYRSGRYDNWHLSLDRAQVTHYMLVRGGLDDARIGHVEGYADRGARPGTDPSNPLNRRIEVLLKDPA